MAQNRRQVKAISIVSGRLFSKDQAVLVKALDNLRNAFAEDVFVGNIKPGEKGDFGARVLIYVSDL